jgi:hypothetical protein
MQGQINETQSVSQTENDARPPLDAAEQEILKPTPMVSKHYDTPLFTAAARPTLSRLTRLAPSPVPSFSFGLGRPFSQYSRSFW